MVKDLAKVAQSGGDADVNSAQKEAALKTLALEAIVMVLKSMVEWSQELYEPPDAAETSATVTESESIAVDDEPVTLQSQASRILTPDKFEQQKQFKLQIEKGCEIFKAAPKKGVRYFIQTGCMTEDPKDIALFLKNTPGIDKSKLGEYLGERYVQSIRPFSCRLLTFH